MRIFRIVMQSDLNCSFFRLVDCLNETDGSLLFLRFIFAFVFDARSRATNDFACASAEIKKNHEFYFICFCWLAGCCCCDCCRFKCRSILARSFLFAYFIISAKATTRMMNRQSYIVYSAKKERIFFLTNKLYYTIIHIFHFAFAAAVQFLLSLSSLLLCEFHNFASFIHVVRRRVL